MKLDPIELADIANPRLLAEAIHGMLPANSFPVPVSEIALGLGIIEIAEIETSSFEGALITNEEKSKASILVRKNSIETRARFTVGHELGHFLIPYHIPSGNGFQCTSKDMREQSPTKVIGRPKWEAEANVFSSNLLMPASAFKQKLRKHREITIEMIISLSDYFLVSKSAFVFRLMQLSDEPFAGIISNNGIVNQVYRHDDFPMLSVQRGLSMPRDCQAKLISGPEDTISDIDTTDPSLWFENDNGKLELFEQMLIQREGWRLTLLTIDSNDSDDD